MDDVEKNETEGKKASKPKREIFFFSDSDPRIAGR